MTDNEKIAAHVNVLSAAMFGIFKTHPDARALMRAFDAALTIYEDRQLFLLISEEQMAYQAQLAERFRVLLGAALD